MKENLSLKEKVMAARGVRLGLLFGMSALMLVSAASAETINWTNITTLLDGIVTIFPSILNMVIAIFPIVVTLSIIGFVIAFLDKILGMIKL